MNQETKKKLIEKIEGKQPIFGNVGIFTEGYKRGIEDAIEIIDQLKEKLN